MIKVKTSYHTSSAAKYILQNKYWNFKKSLLATSFFIFPLFVSGETFADRHPIHVFMQPGIATGAYSLTIGMTSDWEKKWETRLGLLGGYWEVSGGYWLNRDSQSRDAKQFGITPVFRLYPKIFEKEWFVEGAVGLNVITPKYASNGKRFSTAFNFGDHVGIGREFGMRGENELVLRWQHFSNAGIEEPNPGENFLQVRYSRRW